MCNRSEFIPIVVYSVPNIHLFICLFCLVCRICPQTPAAPDVSTVLALALSQSESRLQQRASTEAAAREQQLAALEMQVRIGVFFF